MTTTSGTIGLVLLMTLLAVAAAGIIIRTWLLPAYRGSTVIGLSTGRKRERARPTIDRILK
jgi:capsular polysaccharide biosynthesis protein